MSGGGQRMGAPYMWTVAPRQGKRGEVRRGCNEREKRCQRDKDGG